MIEDKIVLDTGFSSGIGRETAQLLAERGARVFGTVRDFCRRHDESRRVAEVIYRAAADDPPRLRYSVGEGVTFSRLCRFVPVSIFDKRSRERFQFNEPTWSNKK